MINRYKKFLIALGSFALSCAWLLLSTQIKTETGAGVVTSRTFPMLVSGLMVVFSAIITVQEFVSAKKAEVQPSSSKKGDALRVVALIAAMVVYVFLFKLIGFLFSTMFLLLVAMLLYGNKNILTTVLITILFPVILKLLFQYGLKVLLP